MVFTGLHFSERAVTFEDHAWLTSPRAPESLNQHVRLQTPSRGGALPPAVTWPWRGEVPFCSALAFICKACSCKCRVFTNAGIARSLELCPSTKEALKQETRCHGMFQASSTRLNQIIAVSALAASSWKKQQPWKSKHELPAEGMAQPGRHGAAQDLVGACQGRGMAGGGGLFPALVANARPRCPQQVVARWGSRGTLVRTPCRRSAGHLLWQSQALPRM
ncbi:uncharacterized protein M6G45_010145 isoform 1-T1 [Spheniscus humboldti]